MIYVEFLMLFSYYWGNYIKKLRLNVVRFVIKIEIKLIYLFWDDINFCRGDSNFKSMF